MKYKHYIIKRRLEDLLLYPFILTGRLMAYLFVPKQTFETYYFFSFYHTGGAEKVHASIVQATGKSNCVVYFTRKSTDRRFYNDFVQAGCVVKDISKYTDNKLLYVVNLVYRGLVSACINRQQNKPLVFNGQCNFAYKISPWINSEVPQLELSHSFNTFSYIRLPFLPFIHQTIMISKVRIEDHLKQYNAIGVPAKYQQRISYIVNGIELPAMPVAKNGRESIDVLYVGRGTEEKRVHVIAEMARQTALQQLPVRFTFIGDVASAIPVQLHQYCTFTGNVSDKLQIDLAYQQADVVIITSDTEGFPMVIEEGMAHGCIVLATPVGDIPYHIAPQENGFVFSTVTDEQIIIEEGVQFLKQLLAMPETLTRMSQANINYAHQHFGIEAFNQQYQSLFNQFRSTSN